MGRRFDPADRAGPSKSEPPAHTGPTATALREALEGTALDPGSVQILGTLPAIARPGSGFMLTPVIAWSAGPFLTGIANISEVSRITAAPLYQQKGAV